MAVHLKRKNKNTKKNRFNRNTDITDRHKTNYYITKNKYFIIMENKKEDTKQKEQQN